MRTAFMNHFSPKQRKIVRRIAVLLLAYAIIGFFLLPPIVRLVATKQLSKQLGREASVEKVKLNPFTLSTTVRGLLIKDKDGQPFISWDEVYVNFQLASFFGRPWIFKEVRTRRPFVRVQVNKDYTLNFSDLISKFATNAPSKVPSKPLALRIGRLNIAGARASLADLTPRTPFQRTLGPLDVTLENFRTDPDNKNPYAFSGTTDSGEKFAWSGYFYLDPLRSQGDLSLESLALNKYAPLYQDLVRFVVKDGIVDLRASYHLEWSASNHVASVTNGAFNLHSFQLSEAGNDTNIVELPEFSVTGASLDVQARQAEIGAVSARGARVLLRRDQSNAVNFVELSKPSETATNAPGGILLLLRSVTNAVAVLLNTTNAWAGAVRTINIQDCQLDLEDLANSRPVRLRVDNITLNAKNISNISGTNLAASLSFRWNTNGSIKADIAGRLWPPAADVQLTLDNLELSPLDPYLEPNLNVFVLGSKLGMAGYIHLRTTNAELPEVTFQGDVRLDDFSAVDGVLGEDLLKWGSIRFSGIDANLNPPAIAIQQIAVDDVSIRLLIETNRTINLLAALRLSDTNAPGGGRQEGPAKETPKAEGLAAAESSSTEGIKAGRVASLPKISVATVVISNAQVRFTDRSLTPSVNLAIQQAGGTIAGLSSEEFQHADVNLYAKVDNVGPVEITGTINPFSEHRTNEMNVLVKDVDLTPTSPYSEKFAGYRLIKGKLDMALAYHVQGRQLQSQNRITLDRFTFGEKVNSPDATKLPVRLAVAILKDRNGKIELDVPIEGSLDDPEFRLSKVIGRAIVNILTKVATSPFSLLGAVLGGKGEEVSFQAFAPGSADLLLSEKEKLDALAKGMYERPGLQLEIGGSVDPDADRDGLRRAALEKQIRTAKWQSLRKSARATSAPDQLVLTPEERSSFVKKLYAEALDKGQIDLAKLSANTNTAAVASLLQMPTPEIGKGAAGLMEINQPPQSKAGRVATGAAFSKAAVVADPMERALLTTIQVTDNDLEALASGRARAVRDYLLQAGRVEAERLFLTESQTGGLKNQGARAYLQFR